MKYTVRYNRNTVHITGIEEATKVSQADPNKTGVVAYYALSACSTLSRGTYLSLNSTHEDLTAALAAARKLGKVCKQCEKAAERVIAAAAPTAEIEAAPAAEGSSDDEPSPAPAAKKAPKLTAPQRELLAAVGGGHIAHWAAGGFMLPGGKKCNRVGKRLLADGLIKVPYLKGGCTVELTAAGRDVLGLPQPAVAGCTAAAQLLERTAEYVIMRGLNPDHSNQCDENNGACLMCLFEEAYDVLIGTTTHPDSDPQHPTAGKTLAATAVSDTITRTITYRQAVGSRYQRPGSRLPNRVNSILTTAAGKLFAQANA